MLNSSMESTMVARFEAALAAMSDAELQTMWAEVRNEGEVGPTAEEFIASFSRSAAIVNFSFDMSNESFTSAGEYNFAMAA